MDKTNSNPSAAMKSGNPSLVTECYRNPSPKGEFNGDFPVVEEPSEALHLPVGLNDVPFANNTVYHAQPDMSSQNVCEMTLHEAIMEDYMVKNKASTESSTSGFSEISSSISSTEHSSMQNAPGDVVKPTLAFSEISYSIPSGWKRKKKTILEPMSGIMTPGLNAIMGPTGSGKTTLLDILADRKASFRVDGVILYNSEVIQPSFRFSTGYVVQDDIVTGSLTVRENLSFSAFLRLPSHMTTKERKDRVQQVINDLRLNGCADRKIGTDFVRGVSGGERRRTNIGMELITEPEILFLDEPTTGLDAHTAEIVLQILKELTCSKDRIVIMSIHQPRYSIFKLFDTLTLLSCGKLVYHGPSCNSLDYFKNMGYECEEHNNPADFFLDTIVTMEQNSSSRASRSLSNEIDSPVNLVTAFEKTLLYQQIQDQLQPLLQAKAKLPRPPRSCVWPQFNQYATGILQQFLVVCCRSGMNMWRSPVTVIMQLTIMLLMATIIGGIFFQRPDTPRGMQDKLGVLFFLVVSQVFSSMGAVELFIKERGMFLHETSGGYYRVSVYFLAKILTDLMILRLLPLTVFCVVTYFMIGLEADVSKFFIFYLTLVLTTLSGTAVAFTFSALVSVFALANLLVSVVFIVYVLFGGFLIGLSSLPAWIQWMKYVSLFRYAVEALTTNEINGRIFTEVLIPNADGFIDPNDCLFMIRHDNITDELLCVVEGNSVLSFQGYRLNFPWIWYDEIALLVHGVLWLIAAYFILRIIKIYYKRYK